MSLTFEIPAQTDPTKQLTESSQKQYQRHLNHLAQRGFPNIEAIRANIFKAVRTVVDLAPTDSDEHRAKRRFYISAIYWVYPALKARGFNPFNVLWQKSLPTVDFKTGRPWKPKKDYKPPAS